MNKAILLAVFCMTFAFSGTTEADNRCRVRCTPIRNVVHGTVCAVGRVITVPCRMVRSVRCIWQRSNCCVVSNNCEVVSTPSAVVEPTLMAPAPVPATAVVPAGDVLTAPSPPQ